MEGSHTVPQSKLTCQIDLFVSPVELTMPEVELKGADDEVKLPKWIGKHVTDHPGYRNSSLTDSG